ncbi:amidohydrolase [Pseudonocardia acaciae]|uniref:amidohydrolase n=1 Tax=Pseudonocardia acaciae TaxID=551276 RepID=UPI0006880762|nr:amidohydrolase [Pseudonocardia acaciae]
MTGAHDTVPQIFTSSIVHTLADDGVPAFATLGERIVATGQVSRLREMFPGAAVHDFGERALVPGFNDAHQHPTVMAEQLLDVDLSPELVGTRDELLARLRERAESTPAGDWVQGSRYDHTKSTGGVVLTRDDLDRACPDHPVFVRQIGMHWGVLNSVGLRACGLTEDSADPVGGELGRDGSGRLTGAVYERVVFELVDEVIPARGLDERLRGLDRYQRMMHAAGITSVGDALVWPRGLRLLQEAYARGRLSLRVNALLAYPAVEQLEALGLRTGLGDARLRIGGVKAFVDGAIAGGTCLLEEPYEDGCQHGIQAMPTDELMAFVRRVHDAGGTVCVHANGDRAIRLLLDAVEAAQDANPRPGARHRIEHCSIVDPEILKRIAALGMVAVPFGSYVSFHGEKLPGYYGLDRVARMFPHRDLLDAGVAVAGSSDFPCGPYEVLRALRSCVTRRAADGTELGPNQRISPAEALALYTTGSAYAAGEESYKGRLAPGMLADFVVLDRDPLDTPGDELTDITIEQTWVGGERVWSRDE